jgi:SOS-response transcriptional repressor LexA
MSTGCIVSPLNKSIIELRGNIYGKVLLMQPICELIDNTDMNNDKYKAANLAVIRQLNELMARQDINQTEMARLSGVPQPTVHRILSGQSDDPKITILRKIAECLNTTLGELEGGVHVKNGNALAVPLIEWNSIGNVEATVLSPLIPCPTKHGPNTFATRVKDNTMTAQYGRSYPEGSIIFIDPDKASEAQSGDRVFAVIEGSISTFKLYGENDGERYLQSINLQYPIITREFEIKGLIIGMWVPEQ